MRVEGDGAAPVWMGTCGWTDDTLVRCGKFYPRSAKTAVERLAHYSRSYPCVEIDTSTYAIPRPHQVREWMAVVPKGFLFHIKVFGLFPARSVNPASLPGTLRRCMGVVVALLHCIASSPSPPPPPPHPPPHPTHAGDLRHTYLSDELLAAPSVRLSQLPPALVDALWARMNEVIGVLHEGGALGCVVFQFHASYAASPDNTAYVAECRRRLHAPYRMAVEFRSRSWYAATPPVAVYVPPTPPTTSPELTMVPAVYSSQREATLALFRALNIINIPSDDLAAEMPAHEPAQPAYRDGRLHIFDEITSPDAAYIRLHRRRGTDRLLGAGEVAEWVARMHRMAATVAGPVVWGDVRPDGVPPVPTTPPPDTPATWTRLRGPIFFMIGTDWEDQPMQNLGALAAGLAAPGAGGGGAAAVPYDWRARVKSVLQKTGLGAFFGAGSKPAVPVAAAAVEAGAGEGGAGGEEPAATGSSAGAVAVLDGSDGSSVASCEVVAAPPPLSGAKRPREGGGAGGTPARLVPAPSRSPAAARSPAPAPAPAPAAGSLRAFFTSPKKA